MPSTPRSSRLPISARSFTVQACTCRPSACAWCRVVSTCGAFTRAIWPLRVLSSAQGPIVSVDGRRCISLASNDYLGLSRHPVVERAAIAEALFDEKERAQVTLNSIGDAVMSTDVRGNLTYLNVVAGSIARVRTVPDGMPVLMAVQLEPALVVLKIPPPKVAA